MQRVRYGVPNLLPCLQYSGTRVNIGVYVHGQERLVQGGFIYLLTVKEIKPRLLLLEEASAGARSGTVAGFTEANQQSWSCSNLCPRLQLQC